MPVIRILPTFPERPTNPAKCYVATGVIELNAARMRQLTPEAREYVLQHEIGHYVNQSFDEVKADEYALQQLALKKPYSLRNYLDAVNEVSYGNRVRVNQAKIDVLRIAAEQGSEKAKELLCRMGCACADGEADNDSSRKKAIVLAVSICLILLVFYLIKNRKNGK